MTATERRIARVERSLERLVAEVRGLRAEVAGGVERELRPMLRRRGLTWKKVLHEGCPSAPGRAGRTARRSCRACAVFRAGDRLFISNSDPDLVANLGVCLAHYFRRAGYPLDGQL